MTRRPGFTVLEVAIAFAILAVIGSVITQYATTVLRQRVQQEHLEQAIIMAENRLEQSHDIMDADLKAWARMQSLSEPWATRWPQGSLTVTAEPEPASATLARVTVTVRVDALSRPIVRTLWRAGRSR
jgi:Tfp pilus assembly protein PilV